MEEMFITPIQLMSPVSSVNSAGTAGESVVRGQEGITAFKNIFENAINDVRTTSDIKVKEQYLLATGQTENPHSAQIAASNAQLAVDMLVALRSKALESYTEIMRISS
ncbi:flagellar hook-basal body complex protein FliE [Lachnospiraceae bacterium 42-17]|jgi:flagellar hook-basal body complex protein FliE|nr:flagellar hook-basal body complex protein FliE [Dorea sp.]